ncbi:TPA: transposase [Citrobacter freundii]
MWQINEVVRFDGVLHRILSVDNGSVVWIQIEQEKGVPQTLPELMLAQYLEEGRLSRAEDPFADIDLKEPVFGSVEFLKREEIYQRILPIINSPARFDSRGRGVLIEQIASKHQASKPNIYKILRRYWQRGQTPNALIPDYKNSGAPGERRSATGTAKIGRAREYGKGEGTKVTPEIERLFRLTIEKHLLNQKGTKTTVAYRRFVDLFAQYFPRIPQEDYPTLRQFRYFYDREYPKAQRLKSRVKAGIYRKDVRPLSSTATSQALGPGSRYEIDATIADIYLVDHHDRQKIIGRPTLYIVIDVFSRMIAGFYIGFENPSYVVAMQAFVNACSDKTAICAQHDIEISSSDWPCIGLPDVLLADRGELMSHQVEALVSSFNVRVESAPPRRGDAKGIVESTFRTLQAEFKSFAPGIVEGSRIKSHGETDYRLEASLSVFEFTQIILRTILFRNNHLVMDKYDRDADFPTDLPSIPVQLWQWGMQHRTGSLRAVEQEQLRVALLPRRKVSISLFGVNLWGLYYSGSEILREGWLQRSTEIARPQHLEAAYDPVLVDTIYLFPQTGSRVFWRCNLTERSRQFKGLSFWEVWDIQAQEKHNKANAKQDELTKRRELEAFIQQTIQKANKLTPSTTEPKSTRIKQIKTNKKEAVTSERKKRAELLRPSSSGEEAKVIPFNAVEADDQEDYSLPTYVPELFQDPPEEDQS